jgi:hypothetical protein
MLAAAAPSNSSSRMEAEILRKLAQEEAMETASVHSYNSASSRFRAAAAAAQPSALAMLQSVRSMGGMGAMGAGLGRASAPSGIGHSMQMMGQDDGIDNASVQSYTSNASRLRAAAAQPAAMALLQQARGMGASNSSMGHQSLLAPAPGGPSLYEVALLQQRMAMEQEQQSRMRAVAQAASAMRQQHQMQQLQSMLRPMNKRPATLGLRAENGASNALLRLHKRRKIAEAPPLLSASKKNATKAEFMLPQLGGKDSTPTIKSLDSFRSHWDELVMKAKKTEAISKEDDEQLAFVKHHFGKTLAQNRALQNVKKANDSTSDEDSGESDDE